VASTVDLLNTSMLKSGTKESEMAVADDEDAVRSVVMDYVGGVV